MGGAEERKWVEQKEHRWKCAMDRETPVQGEHNERTEDLSVTEMRGICIPLCKQGFDSCGVKLAAP